MPRVPIDDLDDPRIGVYRQLKATNLTRGDDRFVVEGEKLLDRLLDSPFPLASVLATDRNADRIAAKVPADVPLYVVGQATISALVGFNFHQGVLASGQRRPWPGFDEIVERAGPRLTLIVCPKLDNPENLGAIVRIADVFGVAAVVVGERCPDPLSRRVLRVSMGTALRLPVIASADLPRDLIRLRERWGVSLFATVTDPIAEPLTDVRRPDRLAILFGSEANGLDPASTARCDRVLTIPMRPGAESLNVAVAAGIVVHQLMQESSFETLLTSGRLDKGGDTGHRGKE
jgi:tRNA G18 (ribose-2'-O)-methylase SpoU